MFRWPWKANTDAMLDALPWQEALAQPIFTLLDGEEQQALTMLARGFLQDRKSVV